VNRLTKEFPERSEALSSAPFKDEASGGGGGIGGMEGSM